MAQIFDTSQTGPVGAFTVSSHSLVFEQLHSHQQRWVLL